VLCREPAGLRRRRISPRAPGISPRRESSLLLGARLAPSAVPRATGPAPSSFHVDFHSGGSRDAAGTRGIGQSRAPQPAKQEKPREEGYRTAKARRANGWMDRPLLPSEQVRLIEDATQLALTG